MIGATEVDCPDGYLCGAAYVFRFNGNSWVEQQELTAPDATRGAQFGYSVSLTEDRAVVGAISAICDAGAKCGAAYVYGYDGTSWVQQQKLISAAAESGHTFFNEFGHAVAADGPVVAVGEWQDKCPDLRQSCGSATVFRSGVAPVPATSTWGLMSLTLLLLASGTIAIRRRQAAIHVRTV